MSSAVHYRWSELPTDEPMPLVKRQRILGERMMVARVRLDKGFEVPTHAHENEQMAVVVKGRLRFFVDTEERELIVGAGEVLVLPSNVPHRAVALEDSEVLDLFSPPSEQTGVDAGGHA